LEGPFESEFELLAFEDAARDVAAEDLRLDALPVLRLEALVLFALVLFGLLREAPLFALDPFELVDPDFRFVWERELAWAIAPP
jgi:hypothetical protein